MSQHSPSFSHCSRLFFPILWRFFSTFKTAPATPLLKEKKNPSLNQNELKNYHPAYIKQTKKKQTGLYQGVWAQRDVSKRGSSQSIEPTIHHTFRKQAKCQTSKTHTVHTNVSLTSPSLHLLTHTHTYTHTHTHTHTHTQTNTFSIFTKNRLESLGVGDRENVSLERVWIIF